MNQENDGTNARTIRTHKKEILYPKPGKKEKKRVLCYKTEVLEERLMVMKKVMMSMILLWWKDGFAIKDDDEISDEKQKNK